MEKALFEDLKTSLKQMKEIERGERAPGRVRIIRPENEVADTRSKLNMTQAQFANLLGTPISTIRGWEQGRRQPHKTAQILIRLAAKHPRQVLEVASEVA